MGWDRESIGVGIGLEYVFGNNSCSRNNKSEMWGWDGIVISLGLAWRRDMCLLVIVVVIIISLMCGDEIG